MTNYNKQKGTTFETDLMKYFRSRRMDCERLRLAGTKDEGDLVLKVGGLPYIIEAKNRAKLELGTWCKEAEVEALHYSQARDIEMPSFVVISKRRNHPICNSFVTMPLSEWLNQIDQTPF
jgi:Holliday junction resolvase